MFKRCVNAVLLSAKKLSSQCLTKNVTPLVMNARGNSTFRFSGVTSNLIARKVYPFYKITKDLSRGVKRVIDDGAEPHRLLRFDRVRGKRTSVEIVEKQFYRLHWGAWIRTRRGRHKKLYRKSSGLRRKLSQHIFCNAQQSRLLDRLTGPYFKRRHYYVDDEYEPYQSRDEFMPTRRKPLPPTEDVYVGAV